MAKKGDASVTLLGRFLSGAKVKLYRRTSDQFAPASTDVEQTQTVNKDGAVQFTGLPDGVPYWAAVEDEDSRGGHDYTAVVSKPAPPGVEVKKTRAKGSTTSAQEGQAPAPPPDGDPALQREAEPTAASQPGPRKDGTRPARRNDPGRKLPESKKSGQERPPQRKAQGASQKQPVNRDDTAEAQHKEFGARGKEPKQKDPGRDGEGSFRAEKA